MLVSLDLDLPILFLEGGLAWVLEPHWGSGLVGAWVWEEVVVGAEVGGDGDLIMVIPGTENKNFLRR